MRRGNFTHYKRRWQDDEILVCAEYYLLDGIILEDLEQDLGISHSTAYWCFMNRLPAIDYRVYEQILNKILVNHRRAGKRKQEVNL